MAVWEAVTGHPEGTSVYLKMGCDFSSEPIASLQRIMKNCRISQKALTHSDR